MAATPKSKAVGQAHGHHDDHGAPHGTMKSYMIGFVLSVILTAIPFWLVMARPFEGVFTSNVPVALLLILFAAIQIVVHIIFFLHMSPKSEGGWNMMALIFTVTLVVIVLAGSTWVMYHLNTNMMPVHDMEKMDTIGEGVIPSSRDVNPDAPEVP